MDGQPSVDGRRRALGVVDQSLLAHHPGEADEGLAVGGAVHRLAPRPARQDQHPGALHLQEEQILGAHPGQGVGGRGRGDGRAVGADQGRVGRRRANRGGEWRAGRAPGLVDGGVVGGEQARGRDRVQGELRFDEAPRRRVGGWRIGGQGATGLGVGRRPHPASGADGRQGGKVVLELPAGQGRPGQRRWGRRDPRGYRR